MTTHSTSQASTLHQMKPLVNTYNAPPRRSGKTIALFLQIARKVYSVHLQMIEKSPCKYVALPDLESCLRAHRLLNDYKNRGYWSITLGIELQRLSFTPQEVTAAWLYNHKKAGDMLPGSHTLNTTNA